MRVFPRLLIVLSIFGLLVSAQESGPKAIKAIVFTEELSIGGARADENALFGASVGFNVDDRGNFYVLDWDDKVIKKFGPDGKFLLAFGRAGQGPGEFRNPSGVRFAKDGRLYISENWGNKIMYYDANGQYLDQRILEEDIFDIMTTPAGTHLGHAQIAPRYVGEGPVKDSIALFDGNFKPIIVFHEESFTFPDRSLNQAQSQAEIASTFLARPTAMAEMGPDGRIYFGRSDAYAIDVYSPEGKKLFTITRDVKPMAYEKKDIDFYLKNKEEQMKSMIQSESIVKEISRLIRFPKNKPYFRSLIPLEDGRLAVMVDYNGFESSTLDLFDAQGRFLGRVETPFLLMAPLFKNGKAYSLARDEDGFFSIKRYRYEIR